MIRFCAMLILFAAPLCHAGERVGKMQIIVMQALQDEDRLQQLQDRGVLEWCDGVHDYNTLNAARLAERLNRCERFGVKRYWASLRSDYTPQQAAELWDIANRFPGNCKFGWYLEGDEFTHDAERLTQIIKTYGAANVIPYGVHTNERSFCDAIGRSGASCVMGQWYWKVREQVKGAVPTYDQVAPSEPSLYPFRKTLDMKAYVKEHYNRDIDLWFAIHAIGVWNEKDAQGRPGFHPVYIPNTPWEFLCTLLAMDHAGFAGAGLYIHSIGGETPSVEHIDRSLGIALKAYRTGDFLDWPLARDQKWLYSPETHDALQRARRGDINGDGVVDGRDREVVEQNIGSRAN